MAPPSLSQKGASVLPTLSCCGGPQRLCVLACEVGGRWSAEWLRLVIPFACLRAQRAPAALRLGRVGCEAGGFFFCMPLQSTLAATLVGAPCVAHVHGLVRLRTYPQHNDVHGLVRLKTEHPCPKLNDVHGLVHLRTEHPCPKLNDVHGLVRWKTKHPCSKLNDVHGLVRLRTEHPCPKLDDVHGPVRWGTEHPSPKLNDVHGPVRLRTARV